MKKHLSTIILIVMLLAGLSLLLYPSVSNWWNTYHSSQSVIDYTNRVSEMDEEEYKQHLEAAEKYNEMLRTLPNRFYPTDEEHSLYNSTLNISGNGMMGYIDIPKINITIPIYHGIEETVLQIGVGHIEGSSLPIGGEGTHCVLSGHRGLPSAKLFTDLDMILEGDTFTIHTLDEVLTYEVDMIHIVEPQEIGDLAIEADKDYCTLITCTPYGVNSHRLVIRGVRVEGEGRAVQVTSDALQIEPNVVAPFIAMPILAVLLVILLISTKRRKRQTKGSDKSNEK